MFKTFKSIVFQIFENDIIGSSAKESGSLRELIFPNEYKKGLPPQSFNIKIGNVLEKSVNCFVHDCLSISKVEVDKNDIKKEIGYSVQIDTIFEINGIVYYFEDKSNLNLDTEKSKVTFEKVNKILSYLRKRYKNVKGGILSFRFSTSFDVFSVKEPLKSSGFLYGYSDFFNILNINVSKKDWEDFMMEIGEFYINETNC
jgi:hypothetical protein